MYAKENRRYETRNQYNLMYIQIVNQICIEYMQLDEEVKQLAHRICHKDTTS